MFSLFLHDLCRLHKSFFHRFYCNSEISQIDTLNCIRLNCADKMLRRIMLNNEQRTTCPLRAILPENRRSSNRTAGRTFGVEKRTRGEEASRRGNRDWLELMRTRRHFAPSSYAAAPTTVTSFMERAPSSLVPVLGRGRDPKVDGNRVLTSASSLSPLASWTMPKRPRMSSSSSSSSLDTSAKIVNRMGKGFAYGARNSFVGRPVAFLSQSADESGENPRRNTGPLFTSWSQSF